ncbi:hypothetical protein NST99_06975 [Paenibacillus sp. FSL L8-0470]|uniref:hypothetical protein n=1 Tax=Paenibacillus sp. FSL L8-0470 TaxID=2954688 RepID=UPI0030FAE78B
MYRLSVIYRYSEGVEIPKWLIVKPKNGFDWSAETAYISLNQPFERTSQEEINDDTLGISILNTELMINTELPEHIGIHFPYVKKRINKLRGEPLAPSFKLLEIEQFVIQMSDLQIIMQTRSLDILSCNWIDF